MTIQGNAEIQSGETINGRQRLAEALTGLVTTIHGSNLQSSQIADLTSYIKQLTDSINYSIIEQVETSTIPRAEIVTQPGSALDESHQLEYANLYAKAFVQWDPVDSRPSPNDATEWSQYCERKLAYLKMQGTFSDKYAISQLQITGAKGTETFGFVDTPQLPTPRTEAADGIAECIEFIYPDFFTEQPELREKIKQSLLSIQGENGEVNVLNPQEPTLIFSDIGILSRSLIPIVNKMVEAKGITPTDPTFKDSARREYRELTLQLIREHFDFIKRQENPNIGPKTPVLFWTIGGSNMNYIIKQAGPLFTSLGEIKLGQKTDGIDSLDSPTLVLASTTLETIEFITRSTATYAEVVGHKEKQE